MKLDKIIFINWAQIPYGEYDFSSMTLLTGPTGAGKSTMLDGIQTVMTASYQGIVAYNPGQEEVQAGQRRGKSKRTLESFICGAEYSLFSRPEGAQGYIAAVFRPGPDEGTAKPFTALVAASARVDGTGERRGAKLERFELVIVDEEALVLDDFMADTSASNGHGENGHSNSNTNEWVSVDKIIKRLKSKYRKVTSYEGHKKDYLCALYGRFRGRSSITWEETQNAARAWVNSIAYRPIGSVHDLVRDDILEFDAKQLQEGITRIGDLMRQVTNLREEGARIASTVDRLRDLKGSINQTTEAFEEQVQYDLLGAKIHLRDDDARIEQEKKRIESETKSIESSTQMRDQKKAAREGIDRARIDISAKLMGIEAHGMKDHLEEKLASASKAAKETLDELQKGLMSAARMDNAARLLITKAVPEHYPQLRTAVESLALAFDLNGMERMSALQLSVIEASNEEHLKPEKLLQIVSDFEGANDGLSKVYAALVGPANSVSIAIASEYAKVGARIESEQSVVAELAERKRRLASGGGNYSRETAIAVDRIRENLPEAKVQVLCDLVEPLSEEWQPAIEGYIDNARFNLIVTPEWESKTIDFLQSWGSRAKVIQGKHCLEKADEKRVPPNSIIHELKATHAIAKAYLIEQYGAVVKVEDSHQLRTTARGLTKDGKGSGSRTMFVGEKRELVFGRAARERSLSETTASLLTAESSLSTVKSLKKHLDDLRSVLSPLRETAFNAHPLTSASAVIDESRRTLSQLDLTEVKELEARLTQLQQEVKSHDDAIESATKAIALAGERAQKSKDFIDVIALKNSGRVAEIDAQLTRLKQLCEVNPQRTYTVLAQQVDDILINDAVTIGDVNNRRDRLKTLPASKLGEVRELLSEYNSKARSEERFQSSLPHLRDDVVFDPCYGPLVALGKDVSSLHADLEGVGLYNNRDDVEKAERSFHDVFTKQFCVEIKIKVEDGVRTLRQINAELQNLKFGTDRFTIDWSKWEPEFEEYYGFFKAVAELSDSPDTVDLFGDTELTAKHIQVRDRLVSLLLDKDQERAGRELLRIADYRNYRRYEIWNESDTGGRIALSTWGTGSGGQMETPAYIVRAAVVTNRMKLLEKGPSLRLLISDESFQKMDETRICAVLRYLGENLDLQFISAMPTMKVGAVRPEFHREYSFSRANVPQNGEVDFVVECDERNYKSDKMREMWDVRRTEAREQGRMEFEAKEAKEAKERQDPLDKMIAVVDMRGTASRAQERPDTKENNTQELQELGEKPLQKRIKEN